MLSPYLPNTDADRSAMLREIGVSSIEELFQDIPERFRHAHFNLPLPLSELEVKKELRQLATRNASLDNYTCYPPFILSLLQITRLFFSQSS